MQQHALIVAENQQKAQLNRIIDFKETKIADLSVEKAVIANQCENRARAASVHAFESE